MFCFHKWNKVVDGYQYCDKCGKARTVECNHKWKTISTSDLRKRSSITREFIKIGNLYSSVCERCGIHRLEECKIEDTNW
jgi:hypothetical protein